MANIARDERGVLSEDDGGDLQVHGADAELEFLKALKVPGGVLVEIQNLIRTVVFNVFEQAAVSFNLVLNSFEPSD